MSKSTITRLFIAGTLTVVIGVLFEIVALFTTFAGGVIQFGGPNFVTVNGGSAAWLVLGLVLLGGLIMTGGALAALVSWVGALLNTAQLEDKTWFVLLLVLGLVSLGFVAMIAYIVIGPDGTETTTRAEPVRAARA